MKPVISVHDKRIVPLYVRRSYQVVDGGHVFWRTNETQHQIAYKVRRYPVVFDYKMQVRHDFENLRYHSFSLKPLFLPVQTRQCHVLSYRLRSLVFQVDALNHTVTYEQEHIKTTRHLNDFLSNLITFSHSVMYIKLEPIGNDEIVPLLAPILLHNGIPLDLSSYVGAPDIFKLEKISRLDIVHIFPLQAKYFDNLANWI